jgi:hypothetical protein
MVGTLEALDLDVRLILKFLLLVAAVATARSPKSQAAGRVLFVDHIVTPP